MMQKNHNKMMNIIIVLTCTIAQTSTGTSGKEIEKPFTRESHVSKAPLTELEAQSLKTMATDSQKKLGNEVMHEGGRNQFSSH